MFILWLQEGFAYKLHWIIWWLQTTPTYTCTLDYFKRLNPQRAFYTLFSQVNKDNRQWSIGIVGFLVFGIWNYIHCNYSTAAQSTLYPVRGDLSQMCCGKAICHGLLYINVIGLLIFEDMKFQGLFNFNFKQKILRVWIFASMGVAMPEFSSTSGWPLVDKIFILC